VIEGGHARKPRQPGTDVSPVIFLIALERSGFLPCGGVVQAASPLLFAQALVEPEANFGWPDTRDETPLSKYGIPLVLPIF
jgi:hypothetical protein